MNPRIFAAWELQRLWEAAHDIGYPIGTCIQLCLLTGQRLGEVAGITWSEVNRETRGWSLPVHRSKTRRNHQDPLSDGALRLLDQHWRQNPGIGRLFAHQDERPIFATGAFKARLHVALNRRLELGRPAGLPTSMEPFRLHDLRRTMAVWLSDQGARLEEVGLVLNSPPSRRDKLFHLASHEAAKTDLLEQWDRYIASLMERPDAWPGGRDLRA